MPKQSTKKPTPQPRKRKRAEGGGRKPILQNPARVSTSLEQEEADALAMLTPQGKRGMAEVVRQALRDYLAREDVQAQLQQTLTRRATGGTHDQEEER